jgi:hypothetical protein
MMEVHGLDDDLAVFGALRFPLPDDFFLDRYKFLWDEWMTKSRHFEQW